MNNLVKCKRCKQVMIDEQFQNHVCTVELKDLKKINADYFFLTKDPIGRTVIEIKDLEGIIREFTVIPDDKNFNKIPYHPPNLNTESFNGKHPRSKRKSLTQNLNLQHNSHHEGLKNSNKKSQTRKQVW